MSRGLGDVYKRQVYDTLHGDYISGAARMLEAFVTAAAIAIGVGLGMLLLRPLVR